MKDTMKMSCVISAACAATSVSESRPLKSTPCALTMKFAPERAPKVTDMAAIMRFILDSLHRAIAMAPMTATEVKNAAPMPETRAVTK